MRLTPRIAALGYHDLLEPMGDEKYGLLLAIEGGLVLLGFLWYLRWHALMDKQQKLKKPAPLLQALTLRGNKKLGSGPESELVPVSATKKGRASLTARQDVGITLAKHASVTTI